MPNFPLAQMFCSPFPLNPLIHLYILVFVYHFQHMDYIEFTAIDFFLLTMCHISCFFTCLIMFYYMLSILNVTLWGLWIMISSSKEYCFV